MIDQPAASPKRFIPFAIYLAFLASFLTGISLIADQVTKPARSGMRMAILSGRRENGHHMR